MNFIYTKYTIILAYFKHNYKYKYLIYRNIKFFYSTKIIKR